MALPEADTAKYNDFFASFKVNVLPRPPLGKVVTLKDTDSIKAATRELGAHGILSAPVRKASAPEDASWMDKYIGTADAVNLAYWLLEQKEEGDVEHLDELLRQEFSNTPIADVIDTDPATSRFAPFTPLDGERNTLLDCMVLMGKYALHRCYVVEPSADIVNVITQSSLVNFINSNMDKFEIGNKTLKELNLGHRGDVVSISPDKTFLDAFALMQKHGVSAVPMVDEAGAVMGVVSARDARLLILRPTRLRYINKPLRFFEDLHVEPFGWETVCVGEDTTFASLVATLAKTQVHRAFVVDKDKKLTGVVSLRDVIAALVKEPADSQISDYFAT